jgi:hypothetical protein
MPSLAAPACCSGQRASEFELDRSPDLDGGLKRTETGWRFSFEWPALQPRRVRFVTPPLYVTCFEDVHVRFRAKVFADSLPEPVSLETNLNIRVRRQKVHLAEIFEIAGKGKP